MSGVITAFIAIAVAIAAGWLIARLGVLGPHADDLLGKLVYYVLSPPLWFTLIDGAPVRELFSTQLPVAVISAGAIIVVYLAIVMLGWHRPLPESIIGALGAGYSNAGYIGVPVATFALGDPAAGAPIMMFQLIVLGPLAVIGLELSTAHHVSARAVLRATLLNPMLLGSGLGLIAALSGWRPPQVILEPLTMLGAAAVPVVLIGFGMSLVGRRLLEPGSNHRDVWLATALKVVGMPFAAWGAGLALGLRGHDLYTATLLAALPAANLVFNLPQVYRRGLVTGRDIVFMTFFATIPALLIVAALLG